MVMPSVIGGNLVMPKSDSAGRSIMANTRLMPATLSWKRIQKMPNAIAGPRRNPQNTNMAPKSPGVIGPSMMRPIRNTKNAVWAMALMVSPTCGMIIHRSATPRNRLKDSVLSLSKRPFSSLPPKLCTASTLSMPSSTVLVVIAPAARAAWPRRRTMREKRLDRIA